MNYIHDKKSYILVRSTILQQS